MIRARVMFAMLSVVLCASLDDADAAQNSSITNLYEVSAKKGLVVLSVVMNMSKMEWAVTPNRVVLRDTQASKPPISLEFDRCDFDQGTCVLAASVVPGDYYIEQLTYEKRDPSMMYFVWVPVGRDLGEFTVSTGRFTDLGTIVFHWTGVGAGRYVIGHTATDSHVIADVRARHSKRLKRVAMDAPLGWTRITDKSEIVVKHAKRFPALLGAPLDGPDGELIVTGKFGSFHFRGKSGSWQTIDLGVPFRVFDVRRHPNGEWLAFTEYALTFSAPDLAGPWREVDQGDATRNVVYMGLLKDGRTFVLDEPEWGEDRFESPRKLELRIKANDGTWSKLEAPKELALIGRQSVSVHRSNDALSIVEDGKRILRFDLTSAQFEVFPLAKQYSIQYFGGDTFSSLETDTSLFLSKHQHAGFSRDGGQSWVSISSHHPEQEDCFLVAPIVLHDGSIASDRFSVTTPSIAGGGDRKITWQDRWMATADLGKSWSALDFKRAPCIDPTTFVVRDDGYWQLCGDGSIMHRELNGRDWRNELGR